MDSDIWGGVTLNQPGGESHRCFGGLGAKDALAGPCRGAQWADAPRIKNTQLDWRGTLCPECRSEARGCAGERTSSTGDLRECVSPAVTQQYRGENRLEGVLSSGRLVIDDAVIYGNGQSGIEASINAGLGVVVNSTLDHNGLLATGTGPVFVCRWTDMDNNSVTCTGGVGIGTSGVAAEVVSNNVFSVEPDCCEPEQMPMLCKGYLRSGLSPRPRLYLRFAHRDIPLGYVFDVDYRLSSPYWGWRAALSWRTTRRCEMIATDVYQPILVHFPRLLGRPYHWSTQLWQRVASSST